MRCHVARQVVAFAKTLAADGAAQFFLSFLAHGIGRVAAVLRAHVVDEVGRHAE